MIDLHVHSDQSDGTDTPEDLVRLAAARGLRTIAVVDHDTTSGLSRARVHGMRHGVQVIPGIELSARHGDVSVHVLGYFIEEDAKPLQDLLQTIRASRLNRAAVIVDRLSRDFPVAWEEVKRQAGNADSVGRPHIADVLVKKGVAEHRPAAFETLLHDSSPYVAALEAPAVEDAIDVIRAAHGLAVIAHPWGPSRGTESLSPTDFRRWADVGLAGLEVWHREHTKAQRIRLLGIADQLGLYATGGSDYHGAGKPNLLAEHTTSSYTFRRMAEGAAAAKAVVDRDG